MKRLHLIEVTKISLKPVGKIARTVAAPHTKLLEPNQEQALCDFRNLWRTNANPWKHLTLCCQNLFLQMYEWILNSETSLHFIENQLITDFWKTVKAVIKWTDWK